MTVHGEYPNNAVKIGNKIETKDIDIQAYYAVLQLGVVCWLMV